MRVVGVSRADVHVQTFGRKVPSSMTNEAAPTMKAATHQRPTADHRSPIGLMTIDLACDGSTSETRTMLVSLPGMVETRRVQKYKRTQDRLAGTFPNRRIYA